MSVVAEQRAARSSWRAKRSSLTYGSSAVHQLQPAGAVSRDSLLRARRRRAKKFGRSDRPFRILRARSDIARLGPSRKSYPCKGRTFFRGRSCVSSRTSQQPTCSRSAAARYQALRPLSVSIRPSVSSRTYRACPSGGNFLSADHRLQLRSHLWQLSIAHAKGLFPPWVPTVWLTRAARHVAKGAKSRIIAQCDSRALPESARRPRSLSARLREADSPNLHFYPSSGPFEYHRGLTRCAHRTPRAIWQISLRILERPSSACKLSTAGPF